MCTMLLEVVLVSVLAGAMVTLLVQFLLLKWYLSSTPPQLLPHREQFPPFILPQALKNKLPGSQQQQQKEACLWLNMMGQFIFRELRDTSLVRRWVMRKMNLEFQELLQTTSGKLLAQIVVRDFSLGSACPMIGGVCVQDVSLDDDNLIQTLDVCMDVDYDGGFILGVDVVLPFNKMAFISVTLRRLTGRARLQLSRQPYTHWSFSFLQEPDVQFEVESHFEGRPLSQVAALIVNQLRRTIRKKHTLPNYKMRYRPVFPRPEISVPTCRLLVNGQCITVGRLCVTFIKCSRLTPTHDSRLYCTLSADVKPCRELVPRKDKVWVTINVEISKGQADNIGMSFKDEYLLDRYGMAVIVDYVNPDSPAARSDVRKGDVLISVGTARIVSCRHAAKLIKNGGEKFMLKLERPQLKASQDTKPQDDAVLLREIDTEMVENSLMEDGEEFVNITMHTAASDSNLTHHNDHNMPASGAASLSVEQKDKLAKETPVVHVSHSAAQLLRPRSGTDISTGVVVNRNKRAGTDGSSPTSSPRLKRLAPSAPQASQGSEQDSVVGSQASSVAGEQSKLAKVAGTKLAQDPSQGSPRRDRLPAHDNITVEHLAPDKKTEDEVTSVYSIESDSDDDSSPVMKTRDVPASPNPRWHDPLTFDLTEQLAYLNVRVWCHNTEHTDIKADRPTPMPHGDTVLGQVSIPINMLTLQCLMTMQGDSQQTLELQQPGHLKTGVSRKTMAGRINFEPQRCYGDVTLRFQFTPASLSQSQRGQLARDHDPSDLASLTSAGIMSVAQESSQDEQMSDLEGTSPEGRHLFTKTQFNSATYCNFCGKKIWLKEAFQCSACGMICHKKCVDKCHVETLCSQDGPRRRSAPGEFWRTPVRAKKQAEDEAGAQVTKPPTRSSRILSKFVKDTSKSADKDTSKSGSSPRLLRRRKEPAAKVADESEPPIPTDLQFLHGTLDDVAMNSAKQLGRQLFSQLDIAQRKERLDLMVNKMQDDIDQESANKVALNLDLQEAETEAVRVKVRLAIAKSNEKMESLMLLLLQYCAGLQHCLDQEEELRQQASNAGVNSGSVTGAAGGNDVEINGPSAGASRNLHPTDMREEAVDSAMDEEQEDAGTAEREGAYFGCDLQGDTAEEEEQETANAVALVLNELIHSDDSSSSDEDINDEDDSVEKFRPVVQQIWIDKDSVSTISGADLERAKAMLAGIPLEKGLDLERDRDTA